MPKYEYVTVEVKKGFAKATFTQHREIIDQYAQRGYKYVGYVPVEITGYGFLTKIDLVFEKPQGF